MRVSFPMMLMMFTGFVCLSFRFFPANNTWISSSANPVNRIFTYITIELPTRQHRARFSSSDIIMRLNETDMGRRGQQAYNLIDLIRTRSKTTKFSLNVNTLVDE
jgi:hypothetical protein